MFKIGDIVVNLEESEWVEEGAIGIVTEKAEDPFVDWEKDMSKKDHRDRKFNTWVRKGRCLNRIGEL